MYSSLTKACVVKRHCSGRVEILPQDFAITSTYRPFLRPFRVPPFLEVGAESKSSMELAWLRAVPGLEDGVKGGVPPGTPSEDGGGAEPYGEFGPP